MSSRAQRYRLTFEFALRDKSDYQRVCELLRAATSEVELTMNGFMQNDYLAVEKVEEPKR